MDFTTTCQDKIIYNKLKGIWDYNVTRGQIAKIKYFEDPDTKQKGNLLVPKFIIGASKKDVEELASAYLTDNNELLENHPFKYIMLLQIEEQLQTALDYFEVNIENSEFQSEKFSFVKKQYDKIQTLLRNMKNEIHMNENINVDLYEYSKSNVALDMMRRFRIMKDNDPR